VYELLAEHDPAADIPVLLWHVKAKDAASTLCGRVSPPPSPSGSGAARDRYCPPCMAAVGQAVAATRGEPWVEPSGTAHDWQ
jgi:hypothetical protein